MEGQSGEDSDVNFLQASLLTILEASDEGLIVLDGGGRCRMIGRRAGEMFGIEPATYVGKPGVEVLEAFANACDDPDAFWQAAAAPLGGPTTAAEVDVRQPVARTVLCTAVAMVGEGKPRIVLLRDVTLERAAESSTRMLRARLRALMPFDGLTGLLNQRRLFEELAREHSRAVRAWDSYALLRVDIDTMRVINDQFGVHAGDQVLEQIARRLETCVREYDVLARLEGDEFCVLLPGADSVAARAVGERMTKAVAGEACSLTAAGAAAASWVDDDQGLPRLAEPQLPAVCPVTVSIGGALWVPPSRESAEAIFRRAGDALGEAREQGDGKLELSDAQGR
jgi:diguanylate cyclase (GGDEF)-like protein